MNAGFAPGFRTARGKNYGFVIFITAIAAIIVYSSWRYSLARDDGDHMEAPIAGIIIGFLFLVIIAIYAFLCCRRRRKAAPSSQSATEPTPEPWQEQEIHGFNRQHWGGGQHWDNRRYWGNGANTPAVAGNMHGVHNAYNFDAENAAANSNFPEKPPPAYPGGKYDRTWRDPNGNNMLSV
ncbi:hypothetical protein GQ53DRAFT_765939 [Thozetella sp. PMI_491]|nr:hypothetical protein GQ53DRAFT_765939 [Thozetella sp. PMI_491]